MSTCYRPDCNEPTKQRGLCESHYRKKVRMGIYGWRDATPAREHVLKLRDLGWAYEQIAEAAQVSTWVPHKLATGVTQHLWAESERALLAVPLEPRESHRGVDGTGTYRRCEALLWMGWPWAEIDKRVGLRPYSLATYRTRHEPVSYRIARRVAAVYDELSHLPGPSKQTATKARRAGYAPPLAWDEDTIDDPNAKPVAAVDVEESIDELAVEHAVDGYKMNLSEADTREAARRMVAKGYPQAEVCRRLGIRSNALYLWLKAEKTGEAA